MKLKREKVIMKSSAEKEDKSELCKSESSGQQQKFAIKHINSLICVSYFLTIVIALLLASYIHHVGEKSRENQISLEKFLGSELLKFKEYNNNFIKKNERFSG